MKRVLALSAAAVVVVLLIALWWYLGAREAVAPVAVDEEQSIIVEETDEPIVDELPPATVPDDEAPRAAGPGMSEPVAFERTTLTAISPYTGSGTATRSWDGTQFVHRVTADVPAPAAGKFYEGWLVNMDLQPPFFSTGRLELEEGLYALTYTSASDVQSYPQVVITEETSAQGLDGRPEDHVLEGSF